jgi:hypothetical protein
MRRRDSHFGVIPRGFHGENGPFRRIAAAKINCDFQRLRRNDVA